MIIQFTPIPARGTSHSGVLKTPSFGDRRTRGQDPARGAGSGSPRRRGERAVRDTRRLPGGVGSSARPVSQALEASAAAAFPIIPWWVSSRDFARSRPYALGIFGPSTFGANRDDLDTGRRTGATCGHHSVTNRGRDAATAIGGRSPVLGVQTSLDDARAAPGRDARARSNRSALRPDAIPNHRRARRHSE